MIDVVIYREQLAESAGLVSQMRDSLYRSFGDYKQH